ncbi:MAG TPA: class I SAM-dependent methyltransferase [Candidatus Diapherotrites archaeon]|uniref:Class I SAM-dependent methyltransferase n=1 Tax=Candidatus Iainarchaeum sp. TaxID=3101447 RepID=A0A7J4K2A8_9ARCH|nr:class I SAM-dependent methyltransferase [Candidatus Diapherotrites archaeon]
MENDLKRLVVEEFSGVNAQKAYLKKAKDGLWVPESHFIRKYFRKKGAVLDIGCGTGRTTIPLSKLGFKVVGIDLVPAMIENARKVAKSENLKIDYKICDALNLQFKGGAFDYAIFSNQGWTQIPGSQNRLAALKEAFRVLKKGGIFIFTAHQRVLDREFSVFWIKQWVRLYVLKRLGFNVEELDFGDRFFERKATLESGERDTKQYIHIPSIKEVKKEIEKAGFKILEANGKLQISKEDVRKYPPVFYVCQK